MKKRLDPSPNYVMIKKIVSIVSKRFVKMIKRGVCAIK